MSSQAPDTEALPTRGPLVSCIMPTADRLPFVVLALETFQAQSHPYRELIVVDDGDEPVDSLVAGVPGVQMIRVPRGLTLGAKRRLACDRARGEIVMQWDDDDWHGPDRIAAQIAPVVAGEADVTAVSSMMVLWTAENRLVTHTPDLRARMFHENVHLGTLAFRRDLLSEAVAYEPVNLGEDVRLCDALLARGARLVGVEGMAHFVYVRHGVNTWAMMSIGGRSPRWIDAVAPAAFTPGQRTRYVDAARQLGTKRWTTDGRHTTAPRSQWLSHPPKFPNDRATSVGNTPAGFFSLPARAVVARQNPYGQAMKFVHAATTWNCVAVIHPGVSR